MKYVIIAIVLAIYSFVFVHTFNKLQVTEDMLANCQDQAYQLMEKSK